MTEHEVQSKLLFETDDQSELGSAPTAADCTELGWPRPVKGVPQPHPRRDKNTRRCCHSGATLVFVWSQAETRGVRGSWQRWDW